MEGRTEVPRIFNALIVIYVLFTGEAPRALQAALFGLSGGGETAFAMAFISAILVDVVRLAPLFILARHPLGILHPVIIAIVLWPLLISMPATVQEFGGLGGLFLGEPVRPAFFRGLAWQSSEAVWRAIASYNLLQIVGLISAYCGYGLIASPAPSSRPTIMFNSIHMRRLLLILITLTFAGLLIFLSFRGGIEAHLADLARGRFRSLSGMGPLIAVFDLSLLALLLWIASRPQDAKSILFLAALATVILVQFLSNGSRSGSLTVVMLVGLTWSLRTRRIPWRLAFVMAPMIFLALGLLSIARTSGLSGSVTEAVSSTDTSNALAQVQEEIELRRSLAGAVPVVSDGFRVTGPLLGRSYMAAVFASVPRSFWPEKPRGPGSLYAQYFLGEVREGTAVPIGPTAEAYWNFGLPGVVILFFLYGMLLKKAQALYAARGESPFVLCLLVIFLTGFHIYTDLLVSFQQQILLLGIIYMLVRITVPQVNGEPDTVRPARVNAVA